MRLMLFISLVVCVVAATVAWFIYDHRQHEMRSSHIHQMERFVADGEFVQANAFAIIQADHDGDFGDRWVQADIRAAVESYDIARLRWLANRFPKQALASEAASLLLARLALGEQKVHQAEIWMAEWPQTGTQRTAWFTIQLQALRLQDNAEAVEALIQQAEQDDHSRMRAVALMQRALQVSEKPREAFAILQQVQLLAPDMGEAYHFTGNIFERSGNMPAAIEYYLKAIAAEPGNALWRDQLAEAYRRVGAMSLALQSWHSTEAADVPSYFFVKQQFWGRLTAMNSDRYQQVDGDAIRRDQLLPLAQFLQQLSTDQFWDNEAWRLIPGHQIFNARRPEVSWLRVLEFVRNQDEVQALRELEAMSEASIALAPTLQRYLVAGLRLRAGPEATLHHAVFPTIPFGAHQLFYDIAEATRTESEQWDRFVRSPWFIPSLILAEGWGAAAARLQPGVGALLPDSAAYAWARHIQTSQSAEAALGFLAEQSSSELMQLVGAECSMAAQRPGAQKILKTLANTAENSHVAKRARLVLNAMQ